MEGKTHYTGVLGVLMQGADYWMIKIDYLLFSTNMLYYIVLVIALVVVYGKELLLPFFSMTNSSQQFLHILRCCFLLQFREKCCL